MLIDEFLPEHDFVETHEIAVNADASTVFRAIEEVDFADSFIDRWLMRLRGMSAANVTIRNLSGFKFAKLAETRDRELLIGLAGRPWLPWGDLQDVDTTTFRQFDKRGYAKAAWNFSLKSEGEATRLTTETRIKCTDDTSRRRFGCYWTFIQPFSGLIRMEMLRMIKRRVESRG